MVTMYTSFTAENFRGFERFEIHNLKRINLLAGPNGSGKSTLLEAMLIHTGRGDLSHLVEVNRWRGLSSYSKDPLGLSAEPWSYLFLHADQPVRFKSNGAVGDSFETSFQLSTNEQSILLEPVANAGVPASRTAPRALLLEYTLKDREDVPQVFRLYEQEGALFQEPRHSQPKLRGVLCAAYVLVPSNEVARRFTALSKAGKESLLIDALQALEPRLADVMILAPAGDPELHVALDGLSGPQPLALLGNGAATIAHQIVTLASVAGGVLFIDEIETGLHHSILPQFWQAIDEASRLFNVQVFATTHSIEIIQAASQVFREENASDFGYFRMRRDAQGSASVVAYRDEALEGSFEMNLEVRG